MALLYDPGMSKRLFFGKEASLADLEGKLQRLLDSFLNQDVEREAYLQKKAALLSEKKSLEGKIERFEQGAKSWIEPLKKWIKYAENIEKIARSGSGNLRIEPRPAREKSGGNKSREKST